MCTEKMNEICLQLLNEPKNNQIFRIERSSICLLSAQRKKPIENTSLDKLQLTIHRHRLIFQFQRLSISRCCALKTPSKAHKLVSVISVYYENTFTTYCFLLYQRIPLSDDDVHGSSNLFLFSQMNTI